MPLISEKSRSVPASGIREMFALQARFQNVISFALGEPDFITPKHICQAMVDSLNRGETHYTPNVGIQALREAVAGSYQMRQLTYSADEILIGAGAINVLHLACSVVLDIGDEILVPDPGWANYQGLIRQLGAVAVPVCVKEENGFVYDVIALQKAITSKTKAILLNFPSNPTGGVASKHDLEHIAKIALTHDLYVISDEIYRELIWTDEAFTSIASFPGMKERCILIDGFSKTYAMTGLRLGYAAAPRDVVLEMGKLLENVISSVNESVQWAGVAALRGGQACVEEMKRQYYVRRGLMLQGINAIGTISCAPPKGTFYAFVNISKTGLTSKAFSIGLLEQTQTVVVPGTAFGKNGEGFVRLSYATSEENIERGLERINTFVKGLGC